MTVQDDQIAQLQTQQALTVQALTAFLEGKLVFANTTSFNLLGGLNFPL